mmetsp:Transcript_90490/g.235626  ORF Transcript_90490/g.235626 Transcript_90490/m.235626 type:complete len:227 (-) Transcript_90490:946-1626(-)
MLMNPICSRGIPLFCGLPSNAVDGVDAMSEWGRHGESCDSEMLCLSVCKEAASDMRVIHRPSALFPIEARLWRAQALHATEGLPQGLLVQLPLPTAHDHRAHAVAAEVRQRPALRHELVDAEEHGHARRELRPDRDQRGGQADEARARDARGALGGQHGHQQKLQLLCQGQAHAHGLGDEQGGEGHVDVRAVEVEGVPQRNHEADHGLRAAHAPQLGHQVRQRALR